jgi:hypothetical protein
MDKIRIASMVALVAFSTALAEVSDECLDELADAPEKLDNFSLTSYPVDLVTVKGKCSIPVLGGFLCKPETVGLSAKCVKELPTDLGGVQKLLIDMAPDMIRSFVADQLGIKKDRVPTDVKDLKSFAIDIGAEKAADALGVEADEIPRDLKGMEGFISDEARKKAAKALGVEKSAIPKDKSKLAPFIKEQAKKKIASELGIKASEVNLSASALKKYAKEDKSLAPVASLVAAANILGILNTVNGACALLKCADEGSSPKSRAASAEDDDELDEYIDEEEEEKPAKESKQVQRDEDEEDYEEEEEERPAKKPASKKAKSKDEKESDDGGTRFGVRLAYNGSAVRLEGEDQGLGHGLEIGGVANIPFTENLGLNAGLNVLYRTPANMENLKIYEWVLSIPVLCRYGFLDGLIYAEAGIQTDFPLMTESYDGENYAEFKSRAGLDLSVALGFGYNINDNFGLGLRFIYGATEFNKDLGGYKLIQGNLGLTYLF